MNILKRDGRKVDFSKDRIKNSVLKAFEEVDGEISTHAKEKAREIANYIESLNKNMNVEDIQDIVEQKLMASHRKDVAKAYILYRNARTNARENTIDKVIEEIINVSNDYWSSENSNKDEKLCTTQRDYVAGAVSTDQTRRKLLPPDIVEAHDQGIIHFHDADYFLQPIHNCDLVNLEDMLQNGTIISGKTIDKPHKFSTACTIATQIIAQVASSQYGGQSISLAHLSPFIKESYKTFKRKFPDFTEEQLQRLVDMDISDGIQTIQYQITTLMTTNGQAPFITLYMNINEVEEGEERDNLAKAIAEVFKQRIKGVKNEAGVWSSPAFPKLIYAMDENNIWEDSEYFYLTKLAAQCTVKRIVPDYISNKIMRELKKGDTYTCMGCVDGQEIITYLFQNNIFVESFERMWTRLSDYFEVKKQNISSDKNFYMDLKNVKIWDTKKGFVNTLRIIRNWSEQWVDVHLSNGRRLFCTNDHPFETENRGIVRAEELSKEDRIAINYDGINTPLKIDFNIMKAWLLGFVICDGCYSNNHIFASIALKEEDDIAEYFKKAVKDLFDLEVNIIEQHRGKKGEYKDLYIVPDDTNKLQKIIAYLTAQYGGINKKDRHIPNEVFSWSTEAQYSFLAGMIDADGYINSSSHNGSVVQIGSTNKELSLQQMALAQSLGMPAKLYYNHYSKSNPKAVRYRIEFLSDDTLIKYIQCKKKTKEYTSTNNNNVYKESKVMEVIPVSHEGFSYDVTTESEHFEVSGIYSHNCRSFLTPDRTTENYANAKNWDKYKGHKYYGRFNQGVVTINLPDVALSSKGDETEFWKIFEERLELCHRALQCRHKRLLGTKSDTAPILWQNGALARLKKGETIDELLYHGYSTISLGYAGLYECVRYMTGKSHTEEGGKEFALAVMQKMNDMCNIWKANEDIDYSVYGTPIESTTYKFAKCLKDRFGIIPEVTDHDYITNSYHVCVREKINAFDKLRLEGEFQALSPGGAISYIEIPNLKDNVESVISLMQYMYENIMYAEFNTKSDYCHVCGYDGEIVIKGEKGSPYWQCPQCGNTDQNQMTVVRRTCGYLGEHFWNTGRTEEIRDRVLHI